jgi:YNFM family putative membrane transporter
MTIDRRRVAISLAGFCAFLDLYAPQSVLPLLAEELGAGAADISLAISATTLAIALIAPFTGTVADVLGRKRVIAAAMAALVVPTILVALARDLHALVLWRFVQGLLLPPIFTVTVAYIGDEWPPKDVARVAGLYVSGASIGGFSGRFIPGILADLIGWRSAIQVVGLITLAAAVIVTLTLPRETKFVRSDGLLSSLIQMLRHFRDRRLVATFAVGFGVLFNFIATFTYISFHLAAPPYLFSPTLLGLLFVTYLVSSPLMPWSGRAIAMFGRRRFVLGIIFLWIIGALLLLASPIVIILIGLTLCAVCGMFCQTISTSYVTMTAKEGRSSAVGLYACIFYIGGSAGAFLTGLAWNSAGWNGCVALIVAMQIVIAAIVAAAWD